MSPDVRLREVRTEDLDALWRIEADPEGFRLAAFTATPEPDRAEFDRRWRRIFADEDTLARVVEADGEVVGYAASFLFEGHREVSYWIARERWGEGLATRALRALLEELDERPLQARVAADNIGSLSVLESCGFRRCGEGSAFAEARGQLTRELVLVLEDRASP